MMVVIEVAEGHAIHLAIIGIGLAVLAAQARFGSPRGVFGLTGASVALVVVVALGLVHWCDGRIDMADVVYLLAALILGGSIVMMLLRRKAGDGMPGAESHWKAPPANGR
jgi:hypothetical protein